MEINKQYVKLRMRTQFHDVNPAASDAAGYFAGIKLMADEGNIELPGQDLIDGLIGEFFKDNTENIEIYTEGEMYTGDGRIEIRYKESELTDMGDSVTSISFDENDRGLITIMRGGDVYTALVLERGVRHSCVYTTENLPLTIYSTAKSIKNNIYHDGGTLEMVYTVEASASVVQYNRITLTVEVIE